MTMADSGKSWTNQEMLEEFLTIIVTDIYRTAFQCIDAIRDAAMNENPSRLKDRLIDLQIGTVASIFSLIDGASGPTYWPGVQLVDAKTGETLSSDLRSAFSRIEGKCLDSVDP